MLSPQGRHSNLVGEVYTSHVHTRTLHKVRAYGPIAVGQGQQHLAAKHACCACDQHRSLGNGVCLGLFVVA